MSVAKHEFESEVLILDPVERAKYEARQREAKFAQAKAIAKEAYEAAVRCWADMGGLKDQEPMSERAKVVDYMRRMGWDFGAEMIERGEHLK